MTYNTLMENETRLPLLTTDEMMALLASSTLVYTSAPEVRAPEPNGSVSPLSV